MRDLSLERIESVLCLGAHADDIEIGCGGTVLQAIQSQPDLHVTWVVFSAAGERQSEAQRSAEAFLNGCGSTNIEVLDFRDAYFPAQWESIKDWVRQLRQRCDPDLVFTHRLEDRHQDHRAISELTWNHFRDQVILEYEIPKYEGDLTTPAVYVPLRAEIANRKIALLQEHFPTQHTKPWFDSATFEALMRIRGLESEAESKLAEAFFARKLRMRI